MLPNLEGLLAGDTLRILVIEDEDTVRDLVRRVLEKAGYEVLVAPDGQAGYELAQKERLDLVVSDLLTPRMHGYEVLQRLKATPSTRRLPVIVLSAKAYPADQRKALEMGAAAFLAKPFRPPALLEVVSNVLTTVRVRFWGVRGSIATAGPETVRYGGNTPCVTIERGRDLLILDAGTGLRPLGVALQAGAGGRPLDLKMLITHTHWDHIQGFPFFVPAFVPGNTLEIHGPPSLDKPLEKVLKGQMDPEYFPVALGDMAADIRVEEVREPEFAAGPFQVRATYVNHPGVTMAYRVTLDGISIAYATDTEPYRRLLPGANGEDSVATDYANGRDNMLVDFIRDADLYIADSQYTPDDYRSKRGWGHTCYPDAIDVALRANAARVALFSHDPMHDDDAVDRKVAHCRELAAASGTGLEVIPAIEGGAIELPPRPVPAG
jgi:CheY-like chemotaxis protein/phosphoribosyl 1,2-cyclic phosphodiesterase